MKSTEYSRLVDEFTEKSRKSPKEFQQSINRFAFLGVAVLALAFIGGVFLIVTLEPWLVILGIIVLYSILAAILYRPHKIQAIQLNRKDAPLLFDDVDDIVRKLGAPKCDGIYLDFWFNAAAIQFHRFGNVGPMRNYVLVGIPLMDGLSREHVRSTIAHEIGHLMLKHGDQGNKWYAISEMYSNMYENLSHTGAWFLVGPFAKWYLPRFHARLQPVSLRSEFEADAIEARVTSPQSAAAALCYFSIAPDKTEQAVREYCLEAIKGNSRPADLADKVYHSLRNWRQDEAERELSDALLGVTDIEGTHPALAERIAALGAEPVTPMPPSLCASEEYFGTKRADIATAVAAEFEGNNEYYKELKEKLSECAETELELKERLEAGIETEAEAVRFVYARGNLVGRLAAKDVAQKYAAKYPDAPQLQFYYGLSLLSEGDDEGLVALSRSAQLSGGQQGMIYESIYQYLLSRGRAEEAAKFRRRRDEFSDMMADVYVARQKISKDQEYAACVLDLESIDYIRRVLLGSRAVEKGYLVKRKQTDEDVLMHDVVIFPRKYSLIDDANQLTSELESAIGELGEAITVFYGPWLTKRVRERVLAIEGAQIYQHIRSDP